MKLASIWLVSLLSVVLRLAAADKPISSPQFITVQIPGASQTGVEAINNSGTMVGYYYSSSGLHGFALQDGLFITIDDPEQYSESTVCYGINSAGAIVGTYVGDSSGTHKPFLYQNGRYTQVGPHSDGDTVAFAINDAGEIVGYYGDSGFYCKPIGAACQLLNAPGAVTTLASGINDNGLIAVGYFNQFTGNHIALYDGTTYTNIDIPGSTFSGPGQINDAGDVAASFANSDPNTEIGAVWHQGQWHQFMVPGSNKTEASGINDQQVVVGSSWTRWNKKTVGMKLVP